MVRFNSFIYGIGTRLRPVLVIAAAALFIASITTTVMSGTVEGYAGGNGSSSKPFLITSCTDLQNMNDNLGGYYKIMDDIDCSGSSSWNSGAGFEPIGTLADPFTGDLDGQNFTIDGLVINRVGVDYQGLFGATYGATIENVSLTDISVGGKLYVGGIAGLAEASVLINNHVAGLIDGNYTFVGGIVGKGSQIAIQKSSFNGTITAEEVGGGLAGQLDEVSGLTDSFATGTITSTNDVCGGLVAIFENSTAYRNYSAMTMNFGTVGLCGGVAGYVDGVAIVDTFSDSTLNHTDAGSHGGAIGTVSTADFGASGISSIYYNEDLCGCAAGIGVNSVPDDETNPVNVNGVAPNYFKNNTTNPPLDEWDFSSVWQATSSYPTLRIADTPTDVDGDGVSNTIEDQAPNDGDGNNDGIKDSYQVGVSSLLNPSTDNYTTIEIGNCTSIVSPVIGEESTTTSDPAYDYPHGVISFSLTGCPEGEAETIAQYYYGDVSTPSMQLRKFNSEQGTYANITESGLSSGLVGDQQALIVTYQITDGGQHDEDGEANGTIVDPVGLAVSTSTDDSSLANTGDNTAVIVGLIILLLFSSGSILYFSSTTLHSDWYMTRRK